MKAFSIGLIILALAASGRGADTLTEKLQRGLFEEEANHNLAAAMKEYQSIVAQSDEQRKVIATALFRLAECYRKLGQTNEAAKAYQQVLRDYSEQAPLVQLAEKLVNPVNEGTTFSGQAEGLAEGVSPLRRFLVTASNEFNRLQKMSVNDLARSEAAKKDSVLVTLEQQLLAVEQKRAALLGQGLAPEHPEVKSTDAVRQKILEQRNERLAGILASAKENVSSLEALIKRQEGEIRSGVVSPMSLKGTPARLNAESERLLREEIRVAEQLVVDVDKRRAAGRATSSELSNARKDVPRLKRQLPENSSPSQQRSLLEEQLQIVMQQLSYIEKLSPDRRVPGELLLVQRELLSLQRELAVFDDAAKVAGSENASGTILTQAESEELTRVKLIAQNSPDLLNAPARDGYTVLQAAARDGFTAVVEFVLNQGADPNSAVRNTTPLELAAQRGHLRVVQMLLDKGASPNVGNALLNASASGYKSVVELLATRGADVNRKTDQNSTALHAAAWGGHAAIVEILLKNGARPDALTQPTAAPSMTGWGESARYGVTPLHLAVERGFQKISEMLLDAKCSAQVTNYNGTTPLHLAAVSGNTNLMTLLLARGANPNAMTSDIDWTPLMAAISKSSTNAVRLLLENAADANQRGLRNYQEAPHSPLHMASSHWPAPGIVQLLLAANAKIEGTNGAGLTPLHVAVRWGKDEVALLLLEAGADPNQVSSDGMTLLHSAANGRVALLRSLLEHGANPNVVDRFGETPLSRTYSYAAESARTKGLPAGITVPAPPPPIPAGGVYYQWYRDGTTRPVRLEGDFQQIAELLLQHGADEFMQRRGFIRAVRLNQAVPVFVRGTNALNRYTLAEFLAAVYETGGGDFPFPDWSNITIYRLDGKKEKTIRVNTAPMLVNTNCAEDVPLEWGDHVEIPMADHPVAAVWQIGAPYSTTLTECSARKVQFIAGGTNATFTLKTPIGQGRMWASLRGENFRLSSLVQRSDRFRNLLRSSSDLTRVNVSRKDPKTGEVQRHIFDVTRVTLPGSNEQYNGPFPWNQDLWVVDGDIIEVPEKQ